MPLPSHCWHSRDTVRLRVNSVFVSALSRTVSLTSTWPKSGKHVRNDVVGNSSCQALTDGPYFVVAQTPKPEEAIGLRQDAQRACQFLLSAVSRFSRQCRKDHGCTPAESPGCQAPAPHRRGTSKRTP